ncbi:uncharacterized protein LOC100211420 isoform X2 [Hydra vulgaris]|uniref:Uncharacterized protein LOC100211420 isoform X2 n=1 Tax=Hydra vulgaris TaxID=6087 RepID=A0ABM4B7M2_HYDVU
MSLTNDKKHYISLELATRENLKPFAQIIDDDFEYYGDTGLPIPFYSTVLEGKNFENVTWKDQACVRRAQIKWRNDTSVKWLERHLEMTQAFIIIGKNPGLFVLGAPTHNREDMDETQRALPDWVNIKAFVVPAGVGLILHKGTWHDFPVSCGPPVTSFIINTEEVVHALASMKEPQPMNHGDCFKLRLSDHYDCTIHFPDPRPFVNDLGLVSLPTEQKLMGENSYGSGMYRKEIQRGWGGGAKVYVIPVINVEVFTPGCGGPSIQPHLKSIPEIANSGWRDYGNRNGLKRLLTMVKSLNISATAVINSEAVQDPKVRDILKTSGCELGAHGINNSQGNAKMNRSEEVSVFKNCLDQLTSAFDEKPITWLTPGFSVTKRTPEIAALSGIKVLLDFVDDDAPYILQHSENDKCKVLCLPYCLETNDFSLVLTKNYDSQQYAQTIEDHIKQLLKETDTGEKVVCLGMHTFVAGTPARVYALEKMFQRLLLCEDVCFATASQVYELIKNQITSS